MEYCDLVENTIDETYYHLIRKALIHIKTTQLSLEIG